MLIYLLKMEFIPIIGISSKRGISNLSNGQSQNYQIPKSTQIQVKISNVLLVFIVVLFPLYSQVTISGSITNVDGKILSGANIVLKGTSLGVMSDQEGHFTLDIPEIDYIQSDGELVVTYIGYITQKIIIIEDEKNYNIILVRDALDLSQVLVTGRGIISREALGVNIGNISSNECPYIKSHISYFFYNSLNVIIIKTAFYYPVSHML